VTNLLINVSVFSTLTTIVESPPKFSNATTIKQLHLSTYKEDDVNDDQHIFDKVYAAAIRVAILWFL
jgi:hypothetical protein